MSPQVPPDCLGCGQTDAGQLDFCGFIATCAEPIGPSFGPATKRRPPETLATEAALSEAARESGAPWRPPIETLAETISPSSRRNLCAIFLAATSSGRWQFAEMYQYWPSTKCCLVCRWQMANGYWQLEAPADGEATWAEDEQRWKCEIWRQLAQRVSSLISPRS